MAGLMGGYNPYELERQYGLMDPMLEQERGMSPQPTYPQQAPQQMPQEQAMQQVQQEQAMQQVQAQQEQAMQQQRQAQLLQQATQMAQMQKVQQTQRPMNPSMPVQPQKEGLFNSSVGSMGLMNFGLNMLANSQRDRRTGRRMGLAANIGKSGLSAMQHYAQQQAAAQADADQKAKEAQVLARQKIMDQRYSDQQAWQQKQAEESNRRWNVGNDRAESIFNQGQDARQKKITAMDNYRNSTGNGQMSMEPKDRNQAKRQYFIDAGDMKGLEAFDARQSKLGGSKKGSGYINISVGADGKRNGYNIETGVWENLPETADVNKSKKPSAATIERWYQEANYTQWGTKTDNWKSREQWDKEDLPFYMNRTGSIGNGAVDPLGLR